MLASSARWLLVDRALQRRHPVAFLDAGGEGLERFAHPRGVLGRGLDEGEVSAIGIEPNAVHTLTSRPLVETHQRPHGAFRFGAA